MRLKDFLLGECETAVIGENFYVKQQVLVNPVSPGRKIYLVHKGATVIPEMRTEEDMENRTYSWKQYLEFTGYWLPAVNTFINVSCETLDEPGDLTVTTCQQMKESFCAKVMEGIRKWTENNKDSIPPDKSKDARQEAKEMFDRGRTCMNLDDEIEKYIKFACDRDFEFDYIGFALGNRQADKKAEDICRGMQNFIASKKGTDAFLQQMITQSASLDPFDAKRRVRDINCVLYDLCKKGVKTCQAVFDFSGKSGRSDLVIKTSICTNSGRYSPGWIEGSQAATKKFTKKTWLPIAIPYDGGCEDYYPYITGVYTKGKKIYEADPMPVREEEFLYRQLMDKPEADYEELCREYKNADCSFKIDGHGILFHYVMKCRNSTAGGVKYLVEHGALEDDICAVLKAEKNDHI